MLAHDGRHDLWLAANAAFPRAFEDLRLRFGHRVPPGRLFRFHHPQRREDMGDLQFEDCAQAAAFRSVQMLAPDVAWTPSPFEGWGEEGVALLPSPVKSRSLLAATIHDFIPALFPDEYLDVTPSYRTWYLKRLGRLRHCDLLIADSEATRRDALRFLGVANERIVTVPLAADEVFYPRAAETPEAGAVLHDHGITKPFVLFTGNEDFRKNIDGMLQAYALLPGEVRAAHQLVLTQVGDPAVFAARLRRLGLDAREVVVTGAITDEELATLYSLCKVFAFPSLYEGFGLPLLEAMACGAPVLAGDNSSLPEVVGRADALVDASHPPSIAAKLAALLADDDARRDLSDHGLRRAREFTWAATAMETWAALEDLVARHTHRPQVAVATIGRPRIALVTPLPPSQTGIADYASELLPHLRKFFEIDLYVEAPHTVDDPLLQATCRISATSELPSACDRYTAIVYQFGNSSFHTHMVDLIEACPGVAVMHDFFLSNLAFDREWLRSEAGAFAREVDRAHGLRGLVDYRRNGEQHARRAWPMNARVFAAATAVIAHSEHQRELTATYYRDAWQPRVTVVPQLRKLEPTWSAEERAAAKRRLGLDPDAFLVCSFGFVAPTKLSAVILDAFAASHAALGAPAHLAFVGAPEGGPYGQGIAAAVDRHGLGDRFTATGFVDAATYDAWLVAADVAVQLRTGSRGESARTVLDCLANGVPTIVNAHGSLRDHGEDAVRRLPEQVDAALLAAELVALARDVDARAALARNARTEIAVHHHPERIAERYAAAILEACNDDERLVVAAAASAIERGTDTVSAAEFALTACRNDAVRKAPRVLIDVTRIAAADPRTGIERVVTRLVHEFVTSPDPALQVELVRLEDGRLRRALRFAERTFGLPDGDLGDEDLVALRPGDRLFMLDSSWTHVADFLPVFDDIRRGGGRVVSVLYDLIPIRHPAVCHQVVLDAFEPWLHETIRSADDIVCISRAVAKDLAAYMREIGAPEHVAKITWAHLGADLPTATGDARPEILKALDPATPFCLAVGTLEPRKGHATVLDAFDRLWADGSEVRLCIVGRVGWGVDALVDRIRGHAELGRRLHWLDDASDADVDWAYANASAHVCASLTEGFGLPIVEAATRGLPSIVSDIPVFREIGGDGARYFRVTDAVDLATAITELTAFPADERRRLAAGVSVLTWRASAAEWWQAVHGARRPFGAAGNDGNAPRAITTPDTDDEAGLAPADAAARATQGG